nr:protein FIZZY-RELATED 2-like [Ipomoea batatas]GMD40218.1 protein FIZZY-RELATED 2-like [Ipomoea batatas]GMD43468.1 protein FIZZY-RELATED 2-like [Ipomoea batatas]GMD45092.1 protein FIZZY-RELATED 2-like [Ipomoea batatas]GME01497.1 protein FIZZY-RELATED 2-like [Ipomoea batatas]
MFELRGRRMGFIFHMKDFCRMKLKRRQRMGRLSSWRMIWMLVRSKLINSVSFIILNKKRS